MSARTTTPSPFELDQSDAYQGWRTRKLAEFPADLSQSMVAIDDPRALTAKEYRALTQCCARTNLVIYQCAQPDAVDKKAIAAFGKQLGLTRLDHNLCADHDSISSVQAMDNGRQQGYIPYTDHQLNWHTDGYYNAGADSIRAFLLHCVQTASEGGDNELLDPEIVYILMRDEDPEAVRALMHPEAMTVPANEEDGTEIRGPRSGPVFSVDPDTGCLHMRYTARTRSIQWHDDAVTRRAVEHLVEILHNDSKYKFHYRLTPGQGLVCNNVLHTRSALKDSSSHRRLMYRARYYDRIADTSWPNGQ